MQVIAADLTSHKKLLLAFVSAVEWIVPQKDLEFSFSTLPKGLLAMTLNPVLPSCQCRVSLVYKLSLHLKDQHALSHKPHISRNEQRIICKATRLILDFADDVFSCLWAAYFSFGEGCSYFLWISKNVSSSSRSHKIVMLACKLRRSTCFVFFSKRVLFYNFCSVLLDFMTLGLERMWCAHHNGTEPTNPQQR